MTLYNSEVFNVHAKRTRKVTYKVVASSKTGISKVATTKKKEVMDIITKVVLIYTICNLVPRKEGHENARNINRRYATEYLKNL